MEPEELDAAMRAMADSLSRPGPLDEALQRITAAAVETIPGADYASLTVRRPHGEIETLAPTGELPLRADELQYELHEGPCYDAVTDDEFSYTRDLAHDEEWPRFGPRVAELGLLSQLAVPLADRGGTRTGLNLYSTMRGALASSQDLALLFASHARVALGYATELQSLQGAIAHRELIGTAIGRVMERYSLSSERAFEFLIRMSQDSNRKLRDIAAEVVALRDDTGPR